MANMNINDQLVQALLQAMMVPIRPAYSEEMRDKMAVTQPLMVHLIKKRREKLNLSEYEHKDVEDNVAMVCARYWEDKEKLPDIDDFDDFVDYLRDWKYENAACGCLDVQEYMSNEEGKKKMSFIIHRHLIDTGFYPTCQYISNMLTYEMINKEFPTREQFVEYVQNNVEIEQDPEQYYHDHKHQLPTQNMDKIKPFTYDGETKTCGICYNDIEKGDEVIQLPCGGNHVFHVDEEKCLEKHTIVEWMKSNKVCPMCKGEIIIDGT